MRHEVDIFAEVLQIQTCRGTQLRWLDLHRLYLHQLLRLVRAALREERLDLGLKLRNYQDGSSLLTLRRGELRAQSAGLVLQALMLPM